MTAMAAINTAALARAPYLKADKPITDEQGRIQVIIDFTNDAHLKYPGTLPVLGTLTLDDEGKSGVFFHVGKAVREVAPVV